MKKIDGHIHIALSGSNFKESLAQHKASPCESAIRSTLQHYAEAGYSFLRDGGDNLGACSLAARLAPEYGIAYSSPSFPLYEEGNYGSFIGKAFSNPQELEELLNQAVNEGASFIKVMASGIMDFKYYGVLTGHALSLGYLQQIVSFAHSHNLPVMAHANGEESIQNCLLAGVDTIEHGYYLPLEYLDELKKREIIWVPTIAPLVNLLGTGIGKDDVIKDILADHETALRHAKSIGVPIALGSDAGSSHVFHVQGGEDEEQYLLNILCNDRNYLDLGNQLLRFSFSK